MTRKERELLDLVALEVWKTSPANLMIHVEPIGDMMTHSFEVRKEQIEYHAMVEKYPRYQDMLKSMSEYGLQVRCEDTIICRAGVIPVHSHSGIVWLLLCEAEKSVRMRIAKYLIKAVRKYLKELPFKRLETAVTKDFEDGHSFVKFLGFKEEGLMIKAGPSEEDQVRYAIIKEE